MLLGFGPRLLRVAASYCPSEADDLLNGAAEKAWRRPEAFAHGDARKLARWLEQTVRREGLHALRAARRSELVDPATLDEGPEDGGGEPAALLERTEERVATLEALGELPRAQATCLVLNARGHQRGEIALIVGVSERTVRRRLEEGRRALGDFSDDLATGRRCARLARRLSEHVDGTLAPEQARPLRLHLQHCGACRARVAGLRRERAQIASALPPVLLLPSAPLDLDEPPVLLGRQLGELAHDGVLTLSHGLGARVTEGWHTLGPLGRLVTSGLLTLLALAGVGSLGRMGSDPTGPNAMPRAAAPAGEALTAAKPAADRAGHPPRRAAPPAKRRPASGAAPARLQASQTVARARMIRGAVTAVASSAEARRSWVSAASSTHTPGSLPQRQASAPPPHRTKVTVSVLTSAPAAPAGSALAAGRARTEFEPGP